MPMDPVEQVTLELVAERIKGLDRLTSKGFEELQRQLDDVRALPKEVATLRSDLTAAVQRINDLESDDARGLEWRRGQVPMFVLTGLLLIATVVLAVIQLTSGVPHA